MHKELRFFIAVAYISKKLLLSAQILHELAGLVKVCSC